MRISNTTKLIYNWVCLQLVTSNMIEWTMKVIFPVMNSYSRVHFTPLIWSISLLAEGMDGFQLLSQTVIHQSMSLREGLSLKLP